MATIEDMLRKYRNFDECLLLEVRLQDYQGTLELVMNYIWDAAGNIRPNLDETVPLRIRFRLV